MGNNRAAGVTPARYNTRQNMAAYDRLPKAIREALQKSHYNWSAASIASKRRGNTEVLTIPYMVKRIKEEDARLDALNPPSLSGD